MATYDNITTTAQISIAVREIDFISRFQQNWDALREIFGIMNPVKKELGTQIAINKAEVTLNSEPVAEGGEVPFSQATVVPVATKEIALKKYRKGVTAEAVAKYGSAVAVQKTDDAFLTELQGSVVDEFYDFLENGDSTYTLGGATYKTFQMAIAMAIGSVVDKFKKLRKNYADVVVFVNTLDFYEYLGGANISVQTLAGIEYVKNFMGASTMIISSEISRGKVIATPSENIILYYVDPSDSDLAQLGLEYTVAGETPIIGIHMEGNYGRVLGETHALLGLALMVEYADGVAVNTIDPNYVAPDNVGE